MSHYLSDFNIIPYDLLLVKTFLKLFLFFSYSEVLCKKSFLCDALLTIF
nr:MAG TPA: hypothetical protein [Caudoviricetes sp.]